MHENEKLIQKNTTIQIATLCVRGKDLSFVDEMVAGGISGDDCRDVFFDDNASYLGSTISQEEIDDYLSSLKLVDDNYCCRQYRSLSEVLSQPVKHTLTEEDVKVLCSIGNGANICTVFSFPLYILK